MAMILKQLILVCILLIVDGNANDSILVPEHTDPPRTSVTIPVVVVTIVACAVIALIAYYMCIARKTQQPQDEVPAPQQLIDRSASFPTYVYGSGERDSTIDALCHVCLNDFEAGEILRDLPHIYHPRCASQWFSSHADCPDCRYVYVAETMSASTTTLSL